MGELARTVSSPVARERAEELLKQKIEQDSAGHMPQDTREMESVAFGVPNQVIENIGEILDWPVVPSVRIGKEIMAERFQDQERALDQRIVASQIDIVPDEIALERGNMHASAKENE